VRSLKKYPNAFVFEGVKREKKGEASSSFLLLIYFSLGISCHISAIVGTMIVILTVLNLG
jgi:uncharacterized membrane protein